MRIRRRVLSRTHGDIYVTEFKDEKDMLDIVREYAACKSCGAILSLRDIKLCNICKNFICGECLYRVNNQIYCGECIRELYPLELYEYLILKFVARYGYISPVELSSLTGLGIRNSLLILRMLRLRGYLASTGLINKRFVLTWQGRMVINIYDRIFTDL